MRGRPLCWLVASAAALLIAACGGSSPAHRGASTQPGAASQLVVPGSPNAAALPLKSGAQRVPPLLDPRNVYAADGPNNLAPVARTFRQLVYVPNSGSNTVDEIDPSTFQVVRHFSVDALPQHVVPSYDLRTLWVANDIGNSLTPIDPRTGIPGSPVAVADPYNMYFTPDGQYAMVIAEALRRIDFRDPHTMALRRSVSVPECAGVNHADFTSDGRLMLLSCEFGSQMVVVDLATQRVIRQLPLPAGASPQDVKLSPDGSVFYVADLKYGGVWRFDAQSFRALGLLATGAGAHGLYPSRSARRLYVSNRAAGSVSVINFVTGRVETTWQLPSGSSPDMGGVSAAGDVLWLSGRYDSSIYAISTQDGHLIRRIPVGTGPHGLCVYPQPGRYSLGHTGIMR